MSATDEVQLCIWTLFCRTPLMCLHGTQKCARPGEAIAFVDKGFAALGQPSWREQISSISSSAKDEAQ